MSLAPNHQEIDRMARVDLKRRLALSGYEGDLSLISDITTLRQLLNQQVAYITGEPVEVRIQDIWRPGTFRAYTRSQDEDFDRLDIAFNDDDGQFPPERVRRI